MDARPGEIVTKTSTSSVIRGILSWKQNTLTKMNQLLNTRGTMSVQVRTLEKALHDEFDPKRRLHGWARPGMTMDREDFIDLAKVSKRVPGKTPAQVSSPNPSSFRYAVAPFVIC